jgi:hypothetical protein
MNNFKTLLINNPSGVSIQKVNHTYKSISFDYGYFVALTNNVTTIDEYKAVKSHIDALAKALNIKNYFYGYWFDNDSQKACLDLSLHVNNKIEAVALCKLFNQLAYYDCRLQDSIYIKKGGDN